MKRIIASLIFLCIAFFSTHIANSTPHIAAHGQQNNLAVFDLVGWQYAIHCDSSEIYGAIAMTPHYQQTFRPERIAQCLFGPDVTCTDKKCGAELGISGSRFNNGDRDCHDWLGDYFGLPSDFKSTISLNPRVRSFTFDVGLYLGLPVTLRGFHFRINLPLTWTQWQLNAQETIENPGIRGYDEGYFAPTAIAHEALLPRALDFLTGWKAPTMPPGITFDKLGCCRFTERDCPNGNTTDFRLSDIEIAWGWDVISCYDRHAAVYICSSAPSGNRPRGKLLLEPIVGSDNHWKLGAGTNGHYTFWEHEDTTRNLSVWYETRIRHLFRTCQTRCFDLKCKPNSRYALAIRVDKENMSNTQNVRGGSLLGTLANFLFDSHFTSVANITKTTVDVHISIEADAVIKLAYEHGNHTLDVGYQFWGRSCENIAQIAGCKDEQLDGLTWALKGDAHVFGFADNIDDEGNNPQPLSATNSQATIHGGTNRTPETLMATGRTRAQTNPNIDDPQDAFGRDLDIEQQALMAITDGVEADDQTRTTIQPRYLSTNDVDYSGTKGVSHMFFVHVGSCWDFGDHGHTSFFGLGASVEFNGANKCDEKNTVCKACKCKNSAFNQWGIWAKGGFTF